MHKWMLPLDSTGQKGPEIPLEEVLNIVEGCFTTARNGTGAMCSG